MFTPEEQFALDVLELLGTIKRRYLSLVNGEQLIYTTELREDGKRQILRKLEDDGAFSLRPIPRAELIGAVIAQIQDSVAGKPLPPTSFEVRLNQPRFDELYLEYSERAPKTQPDKVEVMLLKEDNRLYLATADSKELIKVFNTGSRVNTLMNYLINVRGNTLVTVEDLWNDIELVAIKNIPEEMRQSDLKPLLQYFGVVIQPSRVELRLTTRMTSQQLDELVQTFRENSGKIGKN